MTYNIIALLTAAVLFWYNFVFVSSSSPSSSVAIFGSRGGGRGNDDYDDGTAVKMGTTLVAIKFNNGVVVAADTRTSVSGYVSNKFAKKINQITNNCVLCRSGSAADTQYLAKEATYAFLARKYRYFGNSILGGDDNDNDDDNLPSISQVSHFLRHKIRQTNNHLQASLICAGVDDDDGSPHIFVITPGGSMWEEPTFCVSGSGSTYLLGLLDDTLPQLLLPSSSSAADNNNNKDNNLYTKDQAIELITKLLHLSMARDGSSGGIVRIMIITKEDGIQEKTIYPNNTVVSVSSSSSNRNNENDNDKDEENRGDDDDDDIDKIVVRNQDLPGFSPPVQPKKV